MAAPAVVAAKITATVMSDEKLRTFALSIIVGLFVVVFLVIGGFITIISSGSQSNKLAVQYIFNKSTIDLSVWDIPQEYRDQLDEIKFHVNAVGNEIDSINGKITGEPIDSYKARVIYLCLFNDNPTTDYIGFIECFYEVSLGGTEEEGIIEVYTAISNEEQIYLNITNKFGVTITTDHLKNITETYNFLMGGGIFIPPTDDSGPPAEAYDDETFKKLMAEATKYIGYPYVYGGSSPSESFDCSGFICWSYTKSGVYNLPRTTAQGIYNQCTPIPPSEAKPGDLVFFEGTYQFHERITHIGIYVGDNKMLHCGDPVGFASLSSVYWQTHHAGFGRLPVSENLL